MENNGKNTVTTGGVSFSGLLTIAFIILKLTKVINWSWLWVLAPLWISVSLWVLYLIVLLIISIISIIIDRKS